MNDSKPIDAQFVEENSGALAVQDGAPAPNLALFNTEDPVEVIQKATRIADALKDVVVKRGLVAKIGTKEYPQVEAWQVLGAMLGVSPVVEWTRQVEGGWEARVVVYNRQGQPISSAENQCTKREKSWASRDDYALRSMAQTRTLAKAYRGALGFIMSLAGYSATPAEEMPRDDATPPADPAQAKTPAPGHEKLRALYAEARKVMPALQEDIRDWAEANVTGYEKGKPLTEAMAWFMANAFTEIAKTPEKGNAPAEPAAYAPVQEQLSMSLMQPINDVQRQSLMILFREKGFTNEAQRHHFCNEVAGKPSSKMFSILDLQKVREALGKMPNAPKAAAK